MQHGFIRLCYTRHRQQWIHEHVDNGKPLLTLATFTVQTQKRMCSCSDFLILSVGDWKKKKLQLWQHNLETYQRSYQTLPTVMILNHFHLCSKLTTRLNIIIPSALLFFPGNIFEDVSPLIFFYIFSLLHGHMSNPSQSFRFYYHQNAEINLTF